MMSGVPPQLLNLQGRQLISALCPTPLSGSAGSLSGHRFCLAPQVLETKDFSGPAKALYVINYYQPPPSPLNVVASPPVLAPPQSRPPPRYRARIRCAAQRSTLVHFLPKLLCALLCLPACKLNTFCCPRLPLGT
jgi:hypothetical protein